VSQAWPITFECQVCHETFERDPKFTEEMARAEYEALHHKPFPGIEQVGIACSECSKKVIEWAREKGMLP
jgi:hypothetical protein